jgi:hypothetical protein
MAEGTRMLQRRATAAVWNVSAYILASGELGITTDTGIIKIGNGTSTWSELDIAFGSEYLPILGTAANSDLLEGIGADSFVKVVDTDTTASDNSVVRRLSDGRAKAETGISTDDVVNFAQMAAADVNARKELVSRTATSALTIALTDISSLIVVNNSAYSPTIVCTIPTNSSVAVPVGSFIDIRSGDKGPVTITPAGGVTVTGQTLLYGGGSSARLVKTGTDAWVVLNVVQSPGPLLRRKIKTGSDNTIGSSGFVHLRLDGADSGTALFSNNVDTLGANEQWSSADLYKCYCRRSGWYHINAQVTLTQALAGRINIYLKINGIEQTLGRAASRSSNPSTASLLTVMVPLNLGDYVEAWCYQEGGSDSTVDEAAYSHSVFEWAWMRPL